MLLSSSRVEKQLFFKRWLSNPREIGALFPSSKKLARLIASQAFVENKGHIDNGGCILELGAGTGSFTQALLEAGVPPKQLICLEIDSQLFSYLKKRFPQLTVLRGDACHLRKVVPEPFLKRIDAVVSGIPMINLTKDLKQRILQNAFDLLKPGQTFYQFTYSPFSPLAAKSLGLSKRRVGTVFSNIPPATVWAYKRVTAQEGLR
jgi:phosphatidylethanolamine/phosphatidyl-N-methylethanolamine N-methyltransferase